MKTISKLSLLMLLILPLAAFPFQAGFCGCSVEGGVCGDPPNWEPCCNPDKYECKKAEKKDEYGTCVVRKEEEK